MTELWDAVKPWVPWLVPASVGVLVVVFTCYMLWPERTARAVGLMVITWDSLAKRFRRRRNGNGNGQAEPPRRSTPAPPTISGFAVPHTPRSDDDEAPKGAA